MEPLSQNDPSSTLVRRGADAETLREMVEFVEEIEHRPLPKLVRDLEGLASLSDRKFELASHVVRRRLEKLPIQEREEIRTLGRNLYGETRDELSSRLQFFLD